MDDEVLEFLRRVDVHREALFGSWNRPTSDNRAGWVGCAVWSLQHLERPGGWDLFPNTPVERALRDMGVDVSNVGEHLEKFEFARALLDGDG